MARRTQAYAIRLAVEGGGQVKAELVSVGQSGEQSLKRIESAGERASGGLKGLGRQAELLRTGIRTLGGALIGAATVGGLGALIDRSISAADAIGKTADKIGVGVEALLELRFAAKASGVEQQTLDMALQRFTRRAAEAAQGTGEAKDALAQMGIALRDQSGNLRRSEDLLADVADGHRRVVQRTPAKRMFAASELPSASLSSGDILFPLPISGRNGAECGPSGSFVRTTRRRRIGPFRALFRLSRRPFSDATEPRPFWYGCQKCVNSMG